MSLPDWDAIQAQLHAVAQRAIARFAATHPENFCSFFAVAAQPYFGHFQICFDTPENAVRQAQKEERVAVTRRTRLLTLPGSWYDADGILEQTPVVDYSPHAALFASFDEEAALFPELEDWEALSAALVATPPPTGRPPGTTPEEAEGDDARDARRNRYLYGQTYLMLWRLLERLIAEEAFAPLRLATPFRVGFQVHEEGLLVVRILRWT
jgi:hypothetical protein